MITNDNQNAAQQIKIDVNNVLNNNNINHKSRVLIYRGSGGLCHNLSGLSHAMYLCKRYKYNILLLDTNNLKSIETHFSTYFDLNIINSIFNIDITENYDDIKKFYSHYNNIPLDEIKNTHAIFRSGNYYIKGINISSLQKQNYSNIVMYCGCGNFSFEISNITIKPSIYNLIQNLVLERTNSEFLDILKSNNFISIHYRNTDMKHDINVFINPILKQLKNKNTNHIFLATDDPNAKEAFQDKLLCENCNIKVHTICQINDYNGQNLHYHEPDKHKLIIDLFIDIFIIMHSSFFFPSFLSSVSKLIVSCIKRKLTIFPCQWNNFPSYELLRVSNSKKKTIK